MTFPGHSREILDSFLIPEAKDLFHLLYQDSNLGHKSFKIKLLEIEILNRIVVEATADLFDADGVSDSIKMAAGTCRVCRKEIQKLLKSMAKPSPFRVTTRLRKALYSRKLSNLVDMYKSSVFLLRDLCAE